MHRGAVGRAALHPTCVHPQCTTHTQSVLLCTQHTRLDLLLAGAIINTPHIEGGADVAAHIHMVCANADARIHRVCAVVRTSSSCGVGGYLHPVMAICTGVHSQIITTRQDSGTHRYLCTKYALISSLACMRPARTHTGCVCMCKKVTCTPPNIPHKHTAVSYTHPTLPTKRKVERSVVPVSFKQKHDIQMTYHQTLICR